MSSFHRTITPSLPTQQIYAVRERKQKNMFEFFIFKHLDSDILELVVTNCDTDTEFEHMILSKKAVLVQVDEELVARFELARMHVADRKRPYATEEGLLEECTNETIGKFIVNHVNVDPKNPKKLLLLPISNRTDAPMSITAIKPRGHSELFYVRDRIESERKESTSSLDAMKPSSSSEPINPNSPRQSPRSSFRGASMVLKAVDAFKQAAVHKETHEQKRAQMHPAKGRLHRSVKKVMLQNAVEKMRSLIGRPPSVDPEAGRSRPTSRNSAFGEIQRKPSHLELAKEDIETRKKSQSPL